MLRTNLVVRNLFIKSLLRRFSTPTTVVNKIHHSKTPKYNNSLGLNYLNFRSYATETIPWESQFITLCNSVQKVLVTKEDRHKFIFMILNDVQIHQEIRNLDSLTSQDKTKVSEILTFFPMPSGSNKAADEDYKQVIDHLKKAAQVPGVAEMLNNLFSRVINILNRYQQEKEAK